MSREQFDIIDEDGATVFRHRATGFIGAVPHGDLCAGVGITIRPGVGSLSRMLASTALLSFPNAEFQVIDPTNVYAPSRWIVGVAKDGSAPVWRPFGRQLLVGKMGSVANPLQIVSAGTTGTFAYKATLPAGLMFPGMRGLMRTRVRKTGAAGAATITLNIGTAGNAADAGLASVTTATTNGREVIFNTVFDVYNATTLTTEGTSVIGADQAVAAADQTTNFNTASAMTLSVNYTKNAGDSVILENIALYLEAF
jgi:hypothetical protein